MYAATNVKRMSSVTPNDLKTLSDVRQRDTVYTTGCVRAVETFTVIAS